MLAGYSVFAYFLKKVVQVYPNRNVKIRGKCIAEPERMLRSPDH
jgi:hypothetical protein